METAFGGGFELLNPTGGNLKPAVLGEGDVSGDGDAILIVVIPAGFKVPGLAWLLKTEIPVGFEVARFAWVLKRAGAVNSVGELT